MGKGVPRLPGPETCWLCGKPILSGHATRALVPEAFVVHARCYERESQSA